MCRISTFRSENVRNLEKLHTIKGVMLDVSIFRQRECSGCRQLSMPSVALPIRFHSFLSKSCSNMAETR